MLERRYKEYFTYHVNNAKATWKAIKQLISSKRSKLPFPNRLTVDGNPLTDAKGMANAILRDPGADSGGEGKSKRAGKYGTKEK